ncbi:MAG TPA: oxygen-dependent coproporphyrinogen oxidase [Cyclobacteriaceae bacterium]|nr:oxygen-dependent coproporphyrinogen oxidase [Cyclobacteriaceae bacterium]
MLSKDTIRDWLLTLQENICDEIQEADGGGSFIEDDWERSGGGGGLSRILTDGKVIEKGGVNFSAVWGKTPEVLLRSMQLDPGDVSEFFATGVSIVMHPQSPMVPIIHMNVRYFEMTGEKNIWWFGGGIDLTPHYVIEEDAVYFHERLKQLCDRHHADYYAEFKKWADDYFYIKHRHETRGVGGIFFDYLKDDENFTKESRFAFVQDVGKAFVPIYTYFMKKNSSFPYGEKEKRWQHIRRGRYVEFNLVWDRGTKFGLDTDGRTESILMSLPPQANWMYNYVPAPGTPEEKTLSLLRKGLDWIQTP